MCSSNGGQLKSEIQTKYKFFKASLLIFIAQVLKCKIFNKYKFNPVHSFDSIICLNSITW